MESFRHDSTPGIDLLQERRREENLLEIPKIIHFVWAGGDKPASEKSMEVIRKWQEANPDFSIWLWVDKSSASSKRHWEEIKNIYEENLPGVILKDIKRENITNSYIDYEINRLRPNYGASSDLIRYAVLERYGGAYFDSDVLPGKKSLSESGIFDKRYDTSQLWVDKKSQMTDLIGNDAFICTPKNEIMKKIQKVAESNYNFTQKEINEFRKKQALLAGFYKINVMTYFYDDFEYIKDITPNKTGPFCVRSAIDNLQVNALTELTTPQINTGNWLKQDLSAALNLKQCQERLIGTMLFEAEHYRILRLDDHISNLIEITDCTQEDAIKIINDNIEALHIDLEELECIKLTFRYPASIGFCLGGNFQEKELLSKTFLLPADRICENLIDDREYFIPPFTFIKELIESIIRRLNVSVDRDALLEDIKGVISLLPLLKNHIKNHLEDDSNTKEGKQYFQSFKEPSFLSYQNELRQISASISQLSAQEGFKGSQLERLPSFIETVLIHLRSFLEEKNPLIFQNDNISDLAVDQEQPEVDVNSVDESLNNNEENNDGCCSKCRIL